jgi:hypothetical protein
MLSAETPAAITARIIRVTIAAGTGCGSRPTCSSSARIEKLNAAKARAADGVPIDSRICSRRARSAN